MSPERDTTPALGEAGGPARWRRAVEGAAVALHRRGFGDARWSYLYGPDTGYATAEAPAHGQVQDAARRARGGEEPGPVQGPVLQVPVWTWEVPVYFWTGGIAAGASFAALACDLAGDHRSAHTARIVALGALGPSPVLLIMDLGRPERFLNMLRILKLRSPMSTGAWALSTFGALMTGAVGADLLGRERAARRAGAAAAVVGGYVGSYTGVLLAATAVPLWSRSRLLLGPIFVATATATGASAVRLALAARGLPAGHPTREALARVEVGAMTAELALTTLNAHRLGRLGDPLEHGRPGRFLRAGTWLVRGGLVLRAAARLGGSRRARGRGPARGVPALRRRGSAGYLAAADHAASAAFLVAGLCLRAAWVTAGQAAARDDEAVARAARSHGTMRA